MIRSAVLLVRTSLPSVLLLAAALLVLTDILSDEPAERAAAGYGSLPSLAPVTPAAEKGGAAILQTALFDAAHRSESIAGSIDDLRSATAPAGVAALSIAGVLLSGETHKAMVSVGGAAPAWSSVGAEVGGWRLAAVDQDGAVVERDGQSVTLKVVDRFRLRTRPSGEPGKAAEAADPSLRPPLADLADTVPRP